MTSENSLSLLDQLKDPEFCRRYEREIGELLKYDSSDGILMNDAIEGLLAAIRDNKNAKP